MFSAIVAASLLIQAPDPWPQTVAETSNYTKTSSYADVISFLDRLQTLGAPIRVETIGESTLGKPIPLVICHENPNITPTQAKAQRKVVVYLQANIHAGEVEGKEAVLRMLRELAQNRNDPVLRDTVLVVQPIYNSDGNDKWGPNERNRGHQDGPDPIGERANGQGLDLNRDCIKAASPEMQAVLRHVYGKWDPEVVMDLHTTNGTRHAYVLTYSPGLSPNCDEAIRQFTQDELLPKMRAEAKRQRGWEFFDYGDASQRSGKWTFSTFACDPRYVTNYASARNRIAILSEAASFQPFKLRVDATHWFVTALLKDISTNRETICQIVREADDRMTKAALQPKALFGVRFEPQSRGEEPITLEIERPASEIDHRKAPTQFRTLTMTVVDRFRPTLKRALPRAYVFRGHERLAKHLALHGILVEQAQESVVAKASFFQVREVNVSPSAFQGVRLSRLEGDFTEGEVNIRPGDFIVRTSQPLAGLAFLMLEPESLDGAMAWGIIDPAPTPGNPYPIAKVAEALSVASRRFGDQP